jgi:hypothetical protein
MAAISVCAACGTHGPELACPESKKLYCHEDCFRKDNKLPSASQETYGKEQVLVGYSIKSGRASCAYCHETSIQEDYPPVQIKSQLIGVCCKNCEESLKTDLEVQGISEQLVPVWIAARRGNWCGTGRHKAYKLQDLTHAALWAASVGPNAANHALTPLLAKHAEEWNDFSLFVNHLSFLYAPVSSGFCGTIASPHVNYLANLPPTTAPIDASSVAQVLLRFYKVYGHQNPRGQMRMVQSLHKIYTRLVKIHNMPPLWAKEILTRGLFGNISLGEAIVSANPITDKLAQETLAYIDAELSNEEISLIGDRISTSSMNQRALLADVLTDLFCVTLFLVIQPEAKLIHKYNLSGVVADSLALLAGALSPNDILSLRSLQQVVANPKTDIVALRSKLLLYQSSSLLDHAVDSMLQSVAGFRQGLTQNSAMDFAQAVKKLHAYADIVVPVPQLPPSLASEGLLGSIKKLGRSARDKFHGVVRSKGYSISGLEHPLYQIYMANHCGPKPTAALVESEAFSAIRTSMETTAIAQMIKNKTGGYDANGARDAVYEFRKEAIKQLEQIVRGKQTKGKEKSAPTEGELQKMCQKKDAAIPAGKQSQLPSAVGMQFGLMVAFYFDAQTSKSKSSAGKGTFTSNQVTVFTDLAALFAQLRDNLGDKITQEYLVHILSPDAPEMVESSPPPSPRHVPMPVSAPAPVAKPVPAPVVKPAPTPAPVVVEEPVGSGSDEGSSGSEPESPPPVPPQRKSSPPPPAPPPPPPRSPRSSSPTPPPRAPSSPPPSPRGESDALKDALDKRRAVLAGKEKKLTPEEEKAEKESDAAFSAAEIKTRCHHLRMEAKKAYEHARLKKQEFVQFRIKHGL